MALTSLPVTAADLLQLQLGIQMSQNSNEASSEATLITAGTTTVSAYASQLIANNISLSQAAMAVDSLMFGVTDNTTELTKLATQFLPAQVANAVANGLNPTVYAAEALGLALSGGNGTSNAFATNFGSLTVSAFAQAVATATGVNANAIQQFVTNWINFYTVNPAASSGLSVTLASYGAAFGDAVGVALVNSTAANLQTKVPNALIDSAEGTYVAGTLDLGSQPRHPSLQGEIQLSSPLGGPLVLSNVTNGTTLVAETFGAGNNLTVPGPGGVADAFTMTATSVAGQDWGTMAFSGFKNVTLAFTAGVGGFDLDLGAILMIATTIIGGGNLNFTGNANVSVSVITTTSFNGLETAHTGFWGNTAAGSTNNPVVAFKNSGTDASAVAINGFIPGSGATMTLSTCRSRHGTLTQINSFPSPACIQ